MQDCRLCQGQCRKAFEARVLQKYKVCYSTCGNCGSLQTEAPYWLAEAYSDAVSHYDLDYLDRGLRVAELALGMSRIIRLPRDSVVLDYGAGAGITTQRLRDFGLKAFAYDKYTKNIFNPNLEWSGNEKPSLVIASEVFEHLPNPSADLQDIFASQPDFLLVTTCLYRGQDKTWPYLGFDHGQHVFLFSPLAIKMVAERFKYEVLFMSDVMIFHKRALTTQKRYLLLTLLRSKLRVARSVYGIWRKVRSIGPNC
jgi:Methyltransferase domain